MQTLEIIIGLVFVFLLLSLLATIIQELVSSLTSLRGRVLLDALIKILEIDDEKLKKEFREKIKNSNVYKKYVSKFLGAKQLPSYLTSNQVVAIFQDILGDETPAEEGDGVVSRGGIDDASYTPAKSTQLDAYALKDKSVCNHLATLQQNTDVGTRGLDGPDNELEEELNKAKAAVAKNFNEMMDRTTGWYKRRVQAVLLSIGMIIAISFDADTFKIYANLTDDPEARQEVIALAQSAVNNNILAKYEVPQDSTTAESNSANPLQRTEDLKILVDSLLFNEINTVKSPLGLGRETFPATPPADVNNELLWRVKKFFGWIVTALAISLGAPFWFDILKLLINIRGSGVVPKEKTSANANAN